MASLLERENCFVRRAGVAPLDRSIHVTIGTALERRSFAEALRRVAALLPERARARVSDHGVAFHGRDGADMLRALFLVPRASMTERFKPLSLDEMNPEQRRMAENVLAGPRKALHGPFGVFVYSPETGDCAQALGAQVRFHNSLPEKLKELAILVVARFWTAQYEWYAHHKLALEAGLDPAIGKAIAEGRRPERMNAEETAVYQFCAELLETKEVSDSAFAGVKDRFGEKGVVDLICTMGYYCLVSMTLNVNRYPLPADATPLLKLK